MTLDHVSHGVAAGLEKGLNMHISPETAIKIGKGSAMVLAHALSEIFTVLQTRADTLHIPSLHSKDIHDFIKRAGVAFRHLPPEMAHSVLLSIQNLVHNARNNKEQIIERLTAAGIIITPILLGTIIALETGFLPAFLAVAPFNTAVINARELRRRRKKITEELGDYKSCIEFIDSFLRTRYSYLNNMPYVNKSIARKLALIDMFSSNKPALGSLIGTILAFPLIWLYSSNPESSRTIGPFLITDEFLYAASAILSEQVSGIAAGGIGKLFDPWKKFSSFVQIIDRLNISSNNENAAIVPATS